MGLEQSIRLRLLIIGLLALASVIGFMTFNVQSGWDFILEYRGSRLLAMLIAAIAIGVSTLVFQTTTHSRILTPSLMGFDALYVLTHALGLLAWARLEVNVAPNLAFVLEILVMVMVTVFLFRLLFNDSVRGLHLLILLGMMGGLLFRELTSFAMLVLDPTEFSIQQGRSMASFSRVNIDFIWWSLVTTAAVVIFVFLMRRKLDVINLGREVAINLGVPYKKTVTWLIVAASVLVSVSTALVGPMLFFGLLATNIAYWLCASHKHSLTLLATIFTGIVFLVGGQLLTEQILQSELPFVMILEILGGLLFIVLLLRGAKQ